MSGRVCVPECVCECVWVVDLVGVHKLYATLCHIHHVSDTPPTGGQPSEQL